MKRVPGSKTRDAQPAIADRFIEYLRTQMLWLHDQNGQDFGEYALVMVLVVVAAALGLSTFGANLSSFFGVIVGAVVGIMP